MSKEWTVYDEIGHVIARYGQDEYRAKEAARVCGTGVTAYYTEHKAA